MKKCQIITLDYPDNPIDIIEKICTLPNACFLDSQSQDRYLIATACPYRLIKTQQGQSTVEHYKYNENVSPYCWQTQRSRLNPFQLLKQQLKINPHYDSEVPFAGGLAGLWSYELGQTIESLPNKARPLPAFEQLVVGLYDWALIIDQVDRRCLLASYHRRPETAPLLTRIQSRLQAPRAQSQTDFQLLHPFQQEMSDAYYQQAFAKIQAYILAGDCYEVNLTQRFSSTYCGDPWHAYLALRQQTQAPFSAWLRFNNLIVLSCSPERFIKVTHRQVETKPIKGTCKRKPCPEEDKAAQKQLKASEKDRAENLMIVDLMRNDLSKHCKPHSVHVPKLFDVESFPGVHHLVSTIQADLNDNADAIDLFKGCFPGGSITGAPKIRAQEIIDELEPVQRGPYCGSIGYIDYNGNMDSNIVIRTAVCKENKIYLQAGGALTAESNCHEEWEECHTKLNPLLHALRPFIIE